MSIDADSPGRERSRIVIVEDDLGLASHFVKVISSAEEIDLSGVASSVSEARNLFSLYPDIFLVDIGLPDGSGLDLIPEIKQQLDARVLIITSFGDRETVVTAIQSGADGYLLKDSSAEELLDGIRVTLLGGAPVSASAAVYLLEHLRHSENDGSLAVQEPDANCRLSKREAEMLSFFARGLSYKETASAMEISPKSVGNYVKSIYSKLAVHSRSEAVYEAVKTGQLEF
ncbi:MAG: response regulator transcription factor [Pseudomonadota bacterium]